MSDEARRGELGLFHVDALDEVRANAFMYKTRSARGDL